MLCKNGTIKIAPPVTQPLSNKELFFEEVLSKLAEIFSSPTPEIPSTKCVSKTFLKKILLKIRDEAEPRGNMRLPAEEILDQLVRSKLIHPINTVDPKTGETQRKFYRLGLSLEADDIDPIELLMAQEPKGVICYFTALDYYGLTTQIPAHHHIAKLNNSSKERPKEMDKKYMSRTRNYNPLGVEMFKYENNSYYKTNRDRGLVPGIKERFLNGKTIFRITSKEQTLLDTLHKPLSCGGPSVVIEAWKSIGTRLDEQKIFSLLQEIGSNHLICRFGYMLYFIDQQIENKELSLLISSAKEAVLESGEEGPIAFLPGIEYQAIEKEWLTW